jgi:hypothetical protein
MIDIEQLIEKFYNGVSTPEDERFLTEFFLSEEHVDKRWDKDRQLFLLLHDMQVQVPAGVSERLEASIRQMEIASSTPVKPLPLHRKRTWYYWISSAAAAVLLCVGLFFIFREPSPPKMADTFTDPAEAALVAQQTLTFVSMQLNKGLDKITEVEQEFERIDQILNKHLSKHDY